MVRLLIIVSLMTTSLTCEEVRAFVFQGGRRIYPATVTTNRRTSASTTISGSRSLRAHVPSRIPLLTRKLTSPITLQSTISDSADDELCVGNKGDDGVEINTSNDDDKERNKSLLKSIEAPSVKKIILFAIPAIGIWLCGPLLSLIDTSAVGILAGTSQQAALNPAITITEDGALLVVSACCARQLDL